jgi:hypothetical protein
MQPGSVVIEEASLWWWTTWINNGVAAMAFRTRQDLESKLSAELRIHTHRFDVMGCKTVFLTCGVLSTITPLAS